MSEPFLGEIRLTPYSFTMMGWASCDGQLLPVDQNTALFSLIGNTYGGTYPSTFAVPNLRGRMPVGAGLSTASNTNYSVGIGGGGEKAQLMTVHLPAHTHQAQASTAAGSSNAPAGYSWAGSTLGAYSTGGTQNLVAMASSALAPTSGGDQAHENRMPYLALNFQIALEGVWPSRS
jgi:microcystin-dependent protein